MNKKMCRDCPWCTMLVDSHGVAIHICTDADSVCYLTHVGYECYCHERSGEALAVKRLCRKCEWCAAVQNSDDDAVLICMDVNSRYYLEEKEYTSYCLRREDEEDEDETD